MEKEIVNQIQQAQRVPNRINQKRNMPRHIVIKFIKIKDGEIIKNNKRNATNNIQENPYKAIS